MEYLSTWTSGSRKEKNGLSLLIMKAGDSDFHV